VGTEVQVSVSGIPGTTPGKVVNVGRVATAPPEEQQQQGRSGPPTIQVIVKVTLPPGSPDLDQAPAGILITTAVRQNVLLVPVVALLARAGGGYEVRLQSGERIQIEPGLYDEVTGSVEVTGNLSVGQLVEVPKS
jgi:hypothetical protein